ncbi:hypothetical protein GCM10008967_41780 [Bacillus carboniphilus]|uniref:BTB domain-containing protein n=1 Tax=Bacillus carboniphilus TaxID=86663 RepID=A0ABN0WUF9_9BACI
MEIVSLQGKELEKALPNSPEDSFSRSEVTFKTGDKEYTFSLLYVRIFEELALQATPFNEQPLIQVEGRSYYVRDLAAFIYLIANPNARGKKEVYLPEQTQLVQAFEQVDWERIEDIVKSLNTDGRAIVPSSIVVLKQP